MSFKLTTSYKYIRSDNIAATNQQQWTKEPNDKEKRLQRPKAQQRCSLNHSNNQIHAMIARYHDHQQPPLAATYDAKIKSSVLRTIEMEMQTFQKT